MNKKKILLLLLIFLVVGIVVLYFVLLMFPFHEPPPLNVTPQMELIILDSGVLDYGYERITAGAPKIEHKSVVYILSQLNGKGIQDVAIRAALFADQIPRDIYLLDYSSGDFRGCVECDGLNDFRDSLERSLKHYGLIRAESTLNQIKLYQLDALTRPSILIVPTGKIPSQLVGTEDGIDLGVLMKKGFVVIFIGSELSSSLNRDGSVQPLSSSQLHKYGIQYKPRTDLVTRAPYKLKKPAFSISENIVGGSLSFVKREDGYLLVFPRSIDIGWGNGTSAGYDVARAIYDVVWQSPLTTAVLIIPSSKINESHSNKTMIFFLPSSYSEGWARMYIMTRTTDDLPLHSLVERKITKTVAGKMLHKSKVARGEVDFTIDFTFFTNFPQPKDVNISVAVYDEDMRLVGKQLAQKGIRFIYGEYSLSSNFIVDFENGVYILKAEDDDGYVYAQSLFIVSPIDITPSLQYWEEPQFITFQAVLPPNKRFGEEVPEPLKNRLILITVNNTPDKDLFEEPLISKTDSGGKFNYSRPDIYLGFGEYTFRFNISGELVSVNVKRAKPPGWFDNPINVALVVLIILIGGVAVVLRRPEKPSYTIDVPDFPPMEKVVIPLSKFSILSLFDSINREYKWSFMPFSAQELKNEMRRKITHKGVPIMITDYNLEKILNELIESGDVVKAVNLYGLKLWEEKSGRSMKYLALFRLLRNFFVNNAIPFTELNSRKDCDMLATVKGEGIYAHIYTDESAFKRALALADSGKNFIVFESRKEMEEVLRKLELSYTQLAVILKSEISNGRITPVHPGNFGVMLGR